MKPNFKIDYDGGMSFSQVGGDHISLMGKVVDGLKSGVGRSATVTIKYDQLKRIIKWAAVHCPGHVFNRDYDNALRGAQWIEEIARDLREEAMNMPEWKKPRRVH